MPFLIASSMRAPPTFSGISRFMPLCPSTAQSIPGTAPSSARLAFLSPTCTSATTIFAPRARRPATSSRAAATGSRASMPAAFSAAASSGVGAAVTPKTPIFTPGGVDDPIGVEQPLAVAAVQVRRDQRQARLLREPPQQRHAQREVALAREERGRADPTVRRRQQAGAALDLAGVGPLAARESSGLGQKQIARVEHQRRVGFGARAIDHRRPARDPAQRVHGTAALFVVAVPVRRIEQRDLLAPRGRRAGPRGDGHGRARAPAAPPARARGSGRAGTRPPRRSRTTAAPAVSSVARAARSDTGRKRRACPTAAPGPHAGARPAC